MRSDDDQADSGEPAQPRRGDRAGPVDAVWRVVVDVTRTGEWSHECLQVQWTGTTDRAGPGARFRGRNRAGRLGWSRACEMLTVDPPSRLVWRTVPTWLAEDLRRLGAVAQRATS